MSSDLNDQMFPDLVSSIFPSDQEIIDLNERGLLEKKIANIIAKSIRENFGDMHSAVKLIAKKIGANPRAVRNWYEAKNPPNCSHLILLSRHMPDIVRIFLQLAGRYDVWNAYEIQRGFKIDPDEISFREPEKKKKNNSENMKEIFQEKLEEERPQDKGGDSILLDNLFTMNKINSDLEVANKTFNRILDLHLNHGLLLRHIWILQKLQENFPLKTRHIANQWSTTIRQAERDMKKLREWGLVS